MDPPALQPGDHRVGDLTGVLESHGLCRAREGERLGRPIRSACRRQAVAEVGDRGRRCELSSTVAVSLNAHRPRAAHWWAAVLGQAGGQGFPVVVGQEAKRMSDRPSGRHHTASSQAQASARRPTFVTLPVAVWGSDGDTRT